MRELNLGKLRARLCGGTDREGGGTGPVVILMHGFGAPGTDLVPVWRELAVPPATRFVFPEAPLALDFGGRAWWHIDMVRLQQRFNKGTALTMIEEVPEGIDLACAAMIELLDTLERDFHAAPARTVIGGFSQGAMLATDVVLRSSRPFGGLAILSGTLLAHAEWQALMPARAGLSVFQSHGKADPVLPFAVAEMLHSELVAAGLRAEFASFNGGHGIPAVALEGLTKLINALPEATP